MTRTIPTLAAAAAAPLLAVGFQAGAQTQTTPDNTPAGPTLTCHLTSGPRAGTSFEFTGTATMPAQLGSDCSDMARSFGTASRRAVAGQPGLPAPNEPRQRSQGQSQAQSRFYQFGQGGYTFVCRFTAGPHAGTSADFSRQPDSNDIRVGSGCTDGAGSTGVAVLPSPSQQQQEQYGPY